MHKSLKAVPNHMKKICQGGPKIKQLDIWKCKKLYQRFYHVTNTCANGCEKYIKIALCFIVVTLASDFCIDCQ